MNKNALQAHTPLRYASCLFFSRRCPCSFTVEAAFSLTLFIFVMIVLMIPLLMLNQQQNLSRALEKAARESAKYHYIQFQGENGSLRKLPQGSAEAADQISLAVLRSELSDPSVRNLLLLDESPSDEMILFKAEYETILPFSVLGLGTLHQETISCRRPWIGADGNRWYSNGGDADKAETLVYISSGSQDVYHSTDQCSYLTKDYKTASAVGMSLLRTDDGSFYRACESCHPSSDAAVVYYTEGGGRYHSSKDCPAMQAFVHTTTLEKALADGRHACSRCG